MCMHVCTCVCKCVLESQTVKELCVCVRPYVCERERERPSSDSIHHIFKLGEYSIIQMGKINDKILSHFRFIL